jgi:hypothetical protein
MAGCCALTGLAPSAPALFAAPVAPASIRDFSFSDGQTSVRYVNLCAQSNFNPLMLQHKHTHKWSTSMRRCVPSSSNALQARKAKARRK